MVAIKRHKPEFETGDEIDGVDILTAEEGRALFDYKARQLLEMSGEEFLHRWDAGEFRPAPESSEDRKLNRLVMLMPFAGRSLA